ncbi:hypothetical protein B9Z55_001109 [Caenorhabditis nigoni]|uniref:Uncharacterized protein n=1 Tax=Caenorhabditis nigoni TaxID=1611254 RepID=A0A2G5VE60_9PELO|nr:hypothetical protein B9Z55_001109 [Caenorhabditis nigoni]
MSQTNRHQESLVRDHVNLLGHLHEVVNLGDPCGCPWVYMSKIPEDVECPRRGGSRRASNYLHSVGLLAGRLRALPITFSLSF